MSEKDRKALLAQFLAASREYLLGRRPSAGLGFGAF